MATEQEKPQVSAQEEQAQQEQVEVLDLTAGPMLPDRSDDSGPSTTSKDEPDPFEEALTDLLVEGTSEWIDDDKEREKYKDRMRRLVPRLVAVWNVGDTLEALEEIQRLPKAVRLIGCLVTVGGTVYTLHPAGLRAQMEKRRAQLRSQAS